MNFMLVSRYFRLVPFCWVLSSALLSEVVVLSMFSTSSFPGPRASKGLGTHSLPSSAGPLFLRGVVPRHLSSAAGPWDSRLCLCAWSDAFLPPHELPTSSRRWCHAFRKGTLPALICCCGHRCRFPCSFAYAFTSCACASFDCSPRLRARLLAVC